MFNQVVSVVANMITQIFNLAFRLFDGLGATGLIFGAFSVLCIYRFLLAPLFGHSAISTIDSVTAKVVSNKRDSGSAEKGE